MTHKHHILPKYLGGTDDSDNLIEVSVAEHAEIHRCLWVYGGRWQDYSAWKTLSGCIEKEDVHRFIVSLANKRPLPKYHKARLKGDKRTRAQKDAVKKLSKILTGRKQPEELIKKRVKTLTSVEVAAKRKATWSQKIKEGWVAHNKGKKMPSTSKSMKGNQNAKGKRWKWKKKENV